MKYVILHDIRSAHNVGAVFRTADGAGVERIYLTGYTPAPIDRFGREVPEIKKTSLGATHTIEWEKHLTVETLIEHLKQAGVSVVGVEQAPEAQSFYDFAVPENVVYIFGNEITGVPPAVCAVCDSVIEIPMAGMKESLNVSVTAGIVLFHK